MPMAYHSAKPAEMQKPRAIECRGSFFISSGRKIPARIMALYVVLL
jgi:hypothetical protein